ncbi:MAG: LacI family DNA-binding transcriptional regulator [Eubacteriales bacterium]|jgi:DNA-binding LacI/PurR family transcriptional regulator
MEKRTTIYDIAQQAKVSPSTVSRVLSKAQYPVKAEVRQRVLEVAKELNYYPNVQARNLKSHTSNNIGVILPAIDDPFYPSIVRGVEDEAVRNNFSIMVCSSNKKQDRIDRYVRSLAEQNVRGIMAIYLDFFPDAMNDFINHGGVVVAVSIPGFTIPDVYNIIVDTGREAYLLTKHLLELGHRRIALLIGSPNTKIRMVRIEGYKRALQEYGIPYEKKYVITCREEDRDGTGECKYGQRMAERLLQEVPEVTGIVCVNDMVALACMHVLQEHGKRIPEDYSVTGMDDAYFSRMIRPEMTTIQFDKYQLGKEMVRIFIEALKKGQKEVLHDYGSHISIVVRKSTGPPRAE